MPRQIPNVVSIAGVDPSGGAGVFADIKTFSALGAYGCGVVAALTAQNTQAVTGVHVPPTDFLRLQIDTLFADVAIHAVKLGMLGSAEIVATVADRLAHFDAPFVVCDPVMVAKSGDHLLARSAVAMLIEALLPRSFMITPNLPEAGVLLEQRPPETVKEMYRAAERLREMLPLSSERWVLLKGGHLPGNEVVDLLFDGDRMIELPSPRIETKNTHGTGCTLSSAVAALLPQHAGGLRPVEAAVRDARDYLLRAIATSGALSVGKGHGPVHHFHRWWPGA
ncbi:MAG: hydroxymethylpyrimidine/phosphomethylpyrimidine kinase [Azoarcus sp.]|uniref:hydroxymethylpyrimidine kinase n=1 Tax=Aromatoleum tolulyticum TaxID=34027 RepID=A0A1N6ZAS9_9RHOO|nr:bifunctional hydroxymethylpyrimidine kinase/phosphomethylpyrimidine kinase [Aromatoleum tolulyticum]MCK9987718.1 hydroxymethylpyrimidine/phosphomethylpyrimidine kinase [Azoarcus sp.]SIR23869.1 hydroxymethylpyrimidine kinase /phosphomethylpyrimidine kinase [Aromatoleum tolulyticum]